MSLVTILVHMIIVLLMRCYWHLCLW